MSSDARDPSASAVRDGSRTDIGREIGTVIDELVYAAVAFHTGHPRLGDKHLWLADALLSAALLRRDECATAGKPKR